MFGLVTRRYLLRLFSLGTASAATSAALAACASPPPAESKPTAAPAAPTTAAQAPTAAAAAPVAQAPTAVAAAPVAKAPAPAAAPVQQPPAQAAGTITLKTQSTWANNDIFHLTFQDLGKKIDEMSGGRLKLDILPNGAVVPLAQLIDAVGQGLLDGGHGVPAYWFGKNKAVSLFGTGPSFGMDAEMMLGWLNYGGGNELYQELIQQKLGLNVVSFLHGPMPTQPLGWFKKEITGPQDLQGLKYRTVGLSADLFKELGVAVTILAGPDIVPALERGVIDGAEFNNPSSDKLYGFQDVSKTLMVQSYHQPVESLEFMINKQKFESLSPDLQAIVKYAVIAQSADTNWKYFLDQNSKDLIDLKSRGVRVIKTPQSVLQAQLEAWDTIITRESQADPFFARVIQSQKEWAQRVVPLRQEILVENQTAYQHFFRNG